MSLSTLLSAPLLCEYWASLTKVTVDFSLYARTFPLMTSSCKLLNDNECEDTKTALKLSNNRNYSERVSERERERDVCMTLCNASLNDRRASKYRDKYLKAVVLSHSRDTWMSYPVRLAAWDFTQINFIFLSFYLYFKR